MEQQGNVRANFHTSSLVKNKETQVCCKQGGEELHFQRKELRLWSVTRHSAVNAYEPSLHHSRLRRWRQRRSFRWPSSLQGEGLRDWLGILTNAGRKDSFAACEGNLQEKRRCKEEIVFEPSQEVQAEPKFWGHFAMSPSLMRTHWRLRLQVHARMRTCPCARCRGGAPCPCRDADPRDESLSLEEAIVAHCGRASTKELLREDCGKATKEERVFDTEHFLPADPVIPIQPPPSLSLRNVNRERRLGWRRLGWRAADDSQVCVERSKAFWEMDEDKSSDMTRVHEGSLV